MRKVGRDRREFSPLRSRTRDVVVPDDDEKDEAESDVGNNKLPADVANEENQPRFCERGQD